MDKSVRIAVYMRVSTDEQARSGFGIEMQRDALMDTIKYKAKHNNWVHKPEWCFIDDGYTGSDLNRPQYKKMLEEVKKKKFDLILVWKIDRLSRSLSHLLKSFEEFQKYGASFFSLKENVDFSGSIGKLTFQIFGALAEFERETIQSRTLEGKIASARMGNYIGSGIPYGYNRDKSKKALKGTQLVLVDKEVQWVNQIFKWFVFEGKNYEQIARDLTTMKIPKGVASKVNNRGVKWYSTTVRDMLRNTSYIGYKIERITTEGVLHEIDVQVPSAISEILFKQAELRAKEVSSTKGNKGGGKNKYLLNRKIIDTETGRKFIGVARTKGGSSYRRKAFFNKEGVRCPNKEIPAEALETSVWNHIHSIINNPEKFYTLYKKQTASSQQLSNLITEEKTCKHNIAQTEIKKDRILNDFYEGNIGDEKKDQLIVQCDYGIKGTQERLLDIQKNIDSLLQMQLAEQAIKEFSINFKEGIDNLTQEQKQILVNILVDHIKVSDNDKGMNVVVVFKFDQSRLNNKNKGYEPKNSIIKTKTTPKGGLNVSTGG